MKTPAALTVIFLTNSHRVVHASRSLRQRANNNERHNEIDDAIIARDLQQHSVSNLTLTLCSDRCSDGCVSYVTPFGKCFNGKQLFPSDDPSWSDFDVLDELIISTTTTTLEGGEQRRFRRSFFNTTNATCGDKSDQYVIPFDKCVGPFGNPRPWGTFTIFDEEDEVVLKTYDAKD